jgi:O-antigen/teichoic acid export membrane protein
MLNKTLVSRGSWTLIDQGCVSLGAFLLNVQLARNLPSAEYGSFAVLLSCFLALQMLNSSLIHHPIAVMLVVSSKAAAERLIFTAATFNVVSSALLASLIGLGTWALGRDELVLPAMASFFAWQMQEGMRRALLAHNRHQISAIGDSINYLGQAAAAALLIHAGVLTLPAMLYCMAAVSTVSAIVQASRLRFKVVGLRRMRYSITANWRAGNWVLVYNIISLARMQGMTWLVAILFGPVEVGHFQAALNVANLANPVILGLCNVIPQAAAESRRRGLAASWGAARSFGLLGMPLTFGYYAIALIAPEFLLSAFYGSQSPYAALTTLARLLILAQMMNYWAEIMASFLNSAAAARVASWSNLVASGVSLALAAVFIPLLGAVGAALVMVIANSVRLGVSARNVAHMTGERITEGIVASTLLKRISVT